MFSDRTLRQYKVSKESFISDGDGLWVRITPAGKKTFVVRSDRGGKTRWKVIGYYPTMTLLEARNRASDAKGRGFVRRTVQEAYLEYKTLLRRTYASWEEIDRRFESDLLPVLGDKSVDRVTRVDCSEAIQVIVARGSRVAANRTLADLKHFFTWCVERGWMEVNPADKITRRSAGGRERPKERALSTQELGRLISDLQVRFSLRTRLALALLLATGQRPSEVLGIQDTEIKGTWWTIPAERTKPKRAHKVYLSPQARAILRLAGSRPFRGLTHRTLDRAVMRLGWDIPFTPHDLRRTMATRLTDLGTNPIVIEKMLNHRLEGTMAVYNVAEFLPERREAWRLWGRHLAQLRRQHAQNIRRTPA